MDNCLILGIIILIRFLGEMPVGLFWRESCGPVDFLFIDSLAIRGELAT
jgi:hypothetical protein